MNQRGHSIAQRLAADVADLRELERIAPLGTLPDPTEPNTDPREPSTGGQR